MQYLISKCANAGDCPHWNVPVSVQGYYLERPDRSLVFHHAVCPIIENARLPFFEQEEQYKYMRCPDPGRCQLYTRFQPSITPEK